MLGSKPSRLLILGIALSSLSLLDACKGKPEPRKGLSRSGNLSPDTPNAPNASQALGLTNCEAPSKVTYRLSRSEIMNGISSVLKLSDTERATLKESLSLDASKTSYENDISSLQVNADQIFAISFALDKLLTSTKIKAIIACGDATDIANTCVKQSLQKMAKQAFSVSGDNDDSLALYNAMLSDLKTKGEQRLATAIKNIFLSMKFLFSSSAKDGLRAHLANTLWLSASEYNADPKLAALSDQDFIKALLNDPKAKRFIEAFIMRRFKLDKLTDGMDPKTDKNYSLISSMKEETTLFLWDIFKNDRPLSEVLSSNTSFVNSELAAHYGMPDPGAGFVKSELPSNRQGLITQGSVLKATSKENESSIIARGQWIVENIFCMHIPEAPNVSPLMEDQDKPNATPREKLSVHRMNPACASCHNLMDPAGFSLENFGPLGEYRAKYSNGLPIDSRGEFSDKTVTNTPTEFFAYVEQKGNDFGKCLSRELLIYTLRRNLQAEDACALDALTQELNQKNSGMGTVLTQILSWYNK